jgi:GNAT superfamily N-acetyltransferase
MMIRAYSIIRLDTDDRPWVLQFLTEHWGSHRIVSLGQVHEADRLPGFYALASAGSDEFSYNERIGLVTYCIEGQACEIVSLDSLVEGIGVGTRLVQQVESTARSAGCKRLWLITSNDNTPALRFYQKRGFRIAAVHRGALDQARLLKPEIPLIGRDGIPLHDAIEFEKLLE